MITFFQAIVIGLLQGFTELFPISSLGHAILIPALFGWQSIYKNGGSDNSFYVAFAVLIHIATSLALLYFYRREWVRIINGFVSSIKKRRITTSHQKLAWLLALATIPAGLIGLIFNAALQSQFAEPLLAAFFLTINGFILLSADSLARKSKRTDFSLETTAQNTTKITYKRAGVIGVSQIFALFPGISRSGITMVGGLASGLDEQDAARFSFLLATPIILAAGLFKLPDILSSNLADARPKMLVGALMAGIAAYFSVKFLDRYFRTRTLKPFAYYCLAFGIFMMLWLTFKG